MKKKFIALALALSTTITCLSVPRLAFAAEAESGTVSTLTIMTTSISFDSISNNEAEVNVYANSSIIPDSITSTVYLQSAPLNTSSFSNVSGVNPETYTVNKKKSITHKCSFPITSTKEYRIKVVLIETTGTSSTQSTHYKKL